MKKVALYLCEDDRNFWLESKEFSEDLGNIDNIYLKDIYDNDESKLFIGIREIKNSRELKEWKTSIREKFLYNKLQKPLDRESLKQEIDRGLKIKYPCKVNICVGYSFDSNNTYIKEEVIKSTVGKSDLPEKEIDNLIKNNTLRIFDVSKQKKSFDKLKVSDLSNLNGVIEVTQLYVNECGKYIKDIDEMVELYLKKYKQFIKSKKFKKI